MQWQKTGYKKCNFILTSSSNRENVISMEAIKISQLKDSKIADEEVVRRVINGEKEWFELLMRRYNQTLYRAIRSYISEERLVEDLMQETYIKSYEKLNQFMGRAAFSTWLVRIGINEALQYLRKNKKRNSAHTHDDEIYKVINFADLTEMNPENFAIKTEVHLLLEKAIDRLEDKYKVVFMLYETEGMSHSDIAACLDLSESNVKVRLHRSKKMLKEELYRMTKDASIFEFGDLRCDRLVKNLMNEIRFL